MKNFLVIFFILFSAISSVKAQDSSRHRVFAGYGYYECPGIGVEHFFKSKTQSVELSFGYDNFTIPNQKCLALTLSYNYAIFRKKINANGNFPWKLKGKTVFWQLTDDFYLWRAVSIIPSLSRDFKLKKRLIFSLDIGPSINFVLYNQRKTFKEIGWPYHVMPDFRILFAYRL